MTAKQLNAENMAPLPPMQSQSAIRSTDTVFNNTAATFMKFGSILLGLIVAKQLVTVILSVLAFALEGSFE